jgi:hypothetical protein
MVRWALKMCVKVIPVLRDRDLELKSGYKGKVVQA